MIHKIHGKHFPWIFLLIEKNIKILLIYFDIGNTYNDIRGERVFSRNVNLFYRIRRKTPAEGGGYKDIDS